ncbi:co-chaperone HscB [Sulfuricurvum kujiense DSM 16994]|uniref:Co-chaperone HscB n=1 Tax=Sulfuricurvum kujiense (strain ATCC BAA-921 / DSM 16994 / JCM 11577 / YK-1) TaxID=709032 RepID=E4TXB9_SULKY|nr:hypothetical protein [Sulfuricurvum kujiense]ADR32816.1 co-chaperone HscB [Sulfuricurvum kujiense DSM 16994]
MPIIKINVEEWSEAFQKAINSKNMGQIQALIRSLPVFEREEEIRDVLLQTMDAEATVLEIRERLVEERKRHSHFYKNNVV